ncbi:MAG: class III extradiol dioxygenase subunit B-like domain-containing protein, partial [bacterium]
FGDISTKMKFKGEMGLAAKINMAAQTNGIPTTMISEKLIDHGVAVPLYYLSKHLQGATVLPIGFSGLDWKTHVEFGYLLKDQIMDSNKRVAIVASGDLSHALTTDAPAGFNAVGAEFDAKIQDLLSTSNVAGLLQLDPEFVENAAECGFRSFLILMGALKGINYSYKSYSYEGPFGVGYLVANFVF